MTNHIFVWENNQKLEQMNFIVGNSSVISPSDPSRAIYKFNQMQLQNEEGYGKNVLAGFSVGEFILLGKSLVTYTQMLVYVNKMGVMHSIEN